MKNEELARDISVFEKSRLGKKLLFSILLFSTIITLFLTTIQIYIDYKNGVDGLYSTVDQIQATQLKSLAQNLWNINNEQVQIQLKGLLEIETIKGLKIYPKDDAPIIIAAEPQTKNDIISTYPIIYERKGIKTNLGSLEIISDLSPVIKTLQSRVLIILLSQGAKTFIVSLFILFIFNLLVSKHLFKISHFAREMSLENIENKLSLSRSPNESRDEIDDLTDNLNLMQDKILQEIKEKRVFQRQLLQSQKMEALGTLASGVAHDFNNILQGLYNALFILEEEVIDNAMALEHLNTAGALVDRARELVKQILIYTKQEKGAFQEFSAVPAIQDVVNILLAAKSNDISINLFIDPPQERLYGDKTQLKQIILNLGNNALHALGNNLNGRIIINVSSTFLQENNLYSLGKGLYLQITVEDNGIGMTEYTQSRIFEPFFSTKEIDKGTGLGLSVVQGIVHKHNGEITFESQIGKGTKFKVLLPLIENSKANEKNKYTGKEKIVLVSTNTILKTIFKKAGIHYNHDLIIFEAADIALAYIKQNIATENILFVVDDNINIFGAEELIRKTRQHTKSLPILYISKNDNTLPINLKTAIIKKDALINSKNYEKTEFSLLISSFKFSCELVS